jgi:glycine/D-amino acid oxidase-like deaminating enzyme
MHFTVVGAGHVGLVTATYLAELRHNVLSVDIDLFGPAFNRIAEAATKASSRRPESCSRI